MLSGSPKLVAAAARSIGLPSSTRARVARGRDARSPWPGSCRSRRRGRGRNSAGSMAPRRPAARPAAARAALTCPSDRLAAALPRASVISARARSMPAATSADVQYRRRARKCGPVHARPAGAIAVSTAPRSQTSGGDAATRSRNERHFIGNPCRAAICALQQCASVAAIKPGALRGRYRSQLLRRPGAGTTFPAWGRAPGSRPRKAEDGR